MAAAQMSSSDEGDHQRNSPRVARRSTTPPMTINSQTTVKCSHFHELQDLLTSSRAVRDHTHRIEQSLEGQPVAMAGKTQPEEGDSGSRSEVPGAGFLDHFQASPSSSVAALVSHYDALSPNPGSNPWQCDSLYSNPPSPTSQREFYNQLSAHSASLYSCSSSAPGHFQRDLAADHWSMPEVDLEEANHRVGSAQGTAHDHQSVDDIAASRGAPTTNHHVLPQNGVDIVEHESSEELGWLPSSGYLSGGSDLAAPASQPQEMNFTRLESSGTAQSSDSTSVAPHLDVRDVRRPRSWMASGQFVGAGDGMSTLPRAPPSSSGAGADPVGSITRSANSVDGTPSNTSLSTSGSGGDEDTDVNGDDDEECTQIDPPESTAAGNGKRKTPEPSGEDLGNTDSARTSSEAAELKKPSTTPLLRRKLPRFTTPREPRYAIKTRTDVDIMDDGFKWRKYGQKAVKNSPHPRNYYRCTTPQCPVRKRVERSRDDAGLVITSYEGTHTHQTPGFRSPPALFSSGDHHPHRPSSPGLFHNPLGLGSSRFPGYPPELSLAALYQLRTLQQAARSLAHHQVVPTISPLGSSPRFPAPSDLQQEISLRRAQQFLGLHDPAAFASSVKQEPLHFTAAHGLPSPRRHSQSPGGRFDRSSINMMRPVQQPIMRPWQHTDHSPSISDLHYVNPPGEFDPSPPASTDTDLVRRVLEAEEQENFANGGIHHDRNVSTGDDELPKVESSPSSHGSAQAFASRIPSRLRKFRSLQRSSSSSQLPPNDDGGETRKHERLSKSKSEQVGKICN